MRTLASVLFASGALAAAIGSENSNTGRTSEEARCIISHAQRIADDAACGNTQSLASCLRDIPEFSTSHLSLYECYTNAGCSKDKAAMEALLAYNRCESLQEQDEEHSGEQDLRKRTRGSLDGQIPTETPAPTSSVKLAAIEIEGGLFARSAYQGDECYETSSFSTTHCPVKTADGKVETLECTDTMATESVCAPEKTCSFDKSGTGVCMDLKNHPDTAGIVIAIVFAVLIVTGIVTITFLCCQDRREQKRLHAKAEASALARAATKKKRADEAKRTRAPLVQNREPSPGPGGDPFQDQNRS